MHSHMKSQETFSLGNMKTDVGKCVSQADRQLVNVRKHVS